MINKNKYTLGTERSAIRELYEYGKKQAELIGSENVFDFSLGNPSIPAPNEINQAICDIIYNRSPLETHGYTSAQGLLKTRTAIANSLNNRFNAEAEPDEIYITCGAAAALCCIIGALTIDNSTEFVAIAPYFPEYKVFVEQAGAKLRVCKADQESFQINFKELEKAINKNTAAVIINSPNNPSGRVYSEQTLLELSKVLKQKSDELGHTIYIISDEPYRELVYENITVPYIPNFYNNTVICYSYSKSLSLPGERIGYFYVPSCADENKALFAAAAGTGRSLGYVCAPSLMQQVITICTDVKPNIEEYTKNRDLLLSELTSYGYECATPDGAFYLFVKAPNGSGAKFSEKAKQKNILIVPGDSFGCPEYVRISYCVPYDTIMRALPYFKELIEC